MITQKDNVENINLFVLKWYLRFGGNRQRDCQFWDNNRIETLNYDGSKNMFWRLGCRKEMIFEND